MWWLPYVAVAAQNVSFANYGDGYLQVIAQGLACSQTNQFRLQRSKDSAAVEGTARAPTNQGYGIFDSVDAVVHESGMFVPEMNTGVGAPALVSDMWSDWVENGATGNAYAYKYAPTGLVYARDTGSIDANIELAPFLSKLPGISATPYNYSAFQRHTREPWTRQHGHNAFPGMLPALHPVLDKDGQEHQQYAVRRCPEAQSNECCLVVENGNAGTEAVNPVGVDSKASTKLDDTDGVVEHKLRWRQKAFHTSFSRGLPDLNTYRANTVTDDLERLYGAETAKEVRDALHASLTTVQTTAGSASDPSNNENELKCRPTQYAGTYSYWAAARLEHFYSAVVGIEEAGMLRQKPPEYDGDHSTDFYLKDETGGGEDNVDFDNSGIGKEFLQTSFDFRDHDCKAQPGGHCGFGYLCKEDDKWESCLLGKNDNEFPYIGAPEEYGKVCVVYSGTGQPTSVGKGKCIKGRWRGRPELLRYSGDGVLPAIPQSNYTRLAHVLDGEQADWYNEEFRMSARLVFTGPKTDAWNQQGSHELPCSVTRMDGLYKNIAGDFSRACGKMRTTQYEWSVD